MIGGRQQVDALVVGPDTVHLGQELVDDVAHPAAAQLVALAADGVEFVEEQHARCLEPGRLEEGVQVAFRVPQPAFQDLVECHGYERGTQLARHRLGEERLPAAGRTVHEQAAAQALAEEPAELRVADRREERRLQSLLGLGHPGHVGERDPALLHVEHRWGGLVAVGGDGFVEPRRDHVLEFVLCGPPVEAVRFRLRADRLRCRRGGSGRGAAGLGRRGRRFACGPGGPLRGWGGEPAHERQCRRVAGFALQCLRDLDDGGGPVVGRQQQLRQVEAEGDVVGCGGHGGAEAVDQRGRVGHASIMRGRSGGGTARRRIGHCGRTVRRPGRSRPSW
ncbi:hypothetical protein LX16_2421 [Stackebrandtia albiflava]|uniref:Uncharacterized protein n=1 Tax=Stackebrandtia albiflava TaxID=406432 RepID=A0A562V1E2_9ACTN|nr:hypothetical protein LX16_2421 [Stackebrandtia albiflava]